MMEFLAYRLDTVNQCLWRRVDEGSPEERILLPPKAFAVLRHLVEHAGRLVTEEELLKAVWPKVYVQPEAIKGQLHEIRKTLGDDPKRPRFIETLPRRGYQFIAPLREVSWQESVPATSPMQGRLVGRERVLLELRERLRAASSGQQQVIFVTGEPGIGKTALVDEFQRLAAGGIPTVLIAHGQCIESHGSTEAYYPILQALGQLCRGSAGAWIIEILATQAPTWLVQFPALLTRQHRETLQREILGATRERMLREIGAALDALVAKAPLLLVLEDLQWADPSTLDLISALARRRASARLLVVATNRPPDDTPSGQQLLALKNDLLAHRLCHEIHLSPLSEAEVGEYLASESSGERLPQGLAQLLYRHTEGNPLFMVAALDHLTERGFIAREDGTWQLKVTLAEIDLGVPETLRQMIEAQINRLSEVEQLALEAASVQGVAFSSSICAAVLDGAAEEYETLYDSMARQSRLVRAAGIDQLPGGAASVRCEFVHALYREVLYERQPLRRRASLHRRIGERLEALYSKQLSEVAVELAVHFEQSADWPRAIKYLRLAVQAAEPRCGHRETTALLERALSLSSKLPAEQRALSEIEILESFDSILYLHLYVSASRFEELATYASRCGILEVEVRALLQMATTWSWSDSKRGLELFDRADRLSARQGDPLARANARVWIIFHRMFYGRSSATEAAEFRSAILQLRDAGRLTGRHLVQYAHILCRCSEFREARRYALQALALLTEKSPANPCADMLQITVAYVLFDAALGLGELGEALRVVEATVAALAKNDNDVYTHGIKYWRALVSLTAMDFEGAVMICQASARALGDQSYPLATHQQLTLTAAAEVALGHYEQALEQLSLAARHGMPYEFTFLFESTRTELCLAKGELAQAFTQGQRLLELALGMPERTSQALAWEANARIALAKGDLAHAEQCIANASAAMEGFETPLAAWQVHATAAALCDRIGNGASGERHRQLSRATILRIADSLPPEAPLRETFLSAPPVAQLLASLASG